MLFITARANFKPLHSSAITTNKRPEVKSPMLAGWRKASRAQQTAALVEIGFADFRQAMPSDWHEPMKACVARLRAEPARVLAGLMSIIASVANLRYVFICPACRAQS